MVLDTLADRNRNSQFLRRLPCTYRSALGFFTSAEPDRKLAFGAEAAAGRVLCRDVTLAGLCRGEISRS